MTLKNTVPWSIDYVKDILKREADKGACIALEWDKEKAFRNFLESSLSRLNEALAADSSEVAHYYHFYTLLSRKLLPSDVDRFVDFDNGLRLTGKIDGYEADYNVTLHRLSSK